MTLDVTLDELMASAELVEKGIPLPPEVSLALVHGSPIGGARPKALIQDEKKKYIAKFSSATDPYSVIKAEFIAMRLAQIAGLNFANVSLRKSSNKDVLLIERFDRVRTKKGWSRKGVISALTLFELDEMMARYASYEDLALLIRQEFNDASLTLKELFQRLVFNILVGNTDDHARNHAALWDGHRLSLTPSYDICPQALSFIEDQMKSIILNWNSVCNLAEVEPIDRKLFGNRQFLNPYIFENLDEDARHLGGYLKTFKSILAI